MSTFSRFHCLLLIILMPLLAFGQGEKKGPANYVTFGLGVLSHSDGAARYANIFEDHFGLDSTILDFDMADLALQITEGYHLNKYLALEGGLSFLDKSTILANITTGETTTQERFEVKQWGFDLYALGKYPVRRWLTVTGKLGGAYWWSDTERLSNGTERKKNSEGLLLGLGLHSEFNERLLVKLDWTKSEIDKVNYVSRGHIFKGVPALD